MYLYCLPIINECFNTILGKKKNPPFVDKKRGHMSYYFTIIEVI
jgi:hypothetical protein